MGQSPSHERRDRSSRSTRSPPRQQRNIVTDDGESLAESLQYPSYHLRTRHARDRDRDEYSSNTSHPSHSSHSSYSSHSSTHSSQTRRTIRQRSSPLSRWSDASFASARAGTSVLRRSRRQAGQQPLIESVHSTPGNLPSPGNLSNELQSTSIIPRSHSPVSSGGAARRAISRRQSIESESMRERNDLSSTSSQGSQRRSEDQTSMLSRLLSVAASATAASLIGSRAEGRSTSHDVGTSFTSIGNNNNEETDNSFDGFLRALEDGQLTSVLRNGETSMGSATQTMDTGNSEQQQQQQQQQQQPPSNTLNFFRMFRFNNTEPSGGDSATGANAAASMERSLVPVIIVGIRSVPPRIAQSMAENSMPSFTDALTGGHVPQPDIVPPESLGMIDEGQDETQNSRPNLSRHGSYEFRAESNSSGGGSDSGAGGANTARDPNSEARSWIIYVLGGSYPENHPILTTPSLFTDSPTYEDMIRLSTLLGPVKPPIASVEALNKAGGIMRVGEDATGALIADRCLICLQDYMLAEEVRYMHECNHVYHRACIDEWLSTASNTCPLCRGIGVKVEQA